MSELALIQNAERYATSRGIKLLDCLGEGTDGTVWRSNRKTAVKVFQSQKNYRMEIDCYLRLREHKITQIMQFAVPRLVWFDDALWVVEMTIVTPPYLIDFGKAHLDYQPEFPPETLLYVEENQREIWENKYDDVQLLLGWLRNKYGIYYQDPRPGNIMFAEQDDSF